MGQSAPQTPVVFLAPLYAGVEVSSRYIQIRNCIKKLHSQCAAKFVKSTQKLRRNTPQILTLGTSKWWVYR